MSYRTNTDNIYPEGTILTAHADLSRKLKIMKYHQRIYYCAIVGHEGAKHLVYYERELMPPEKKDK